LRKRCFSSHEADLALCMLVCISEASETQGTEFIRTLDADKFVKRFCRSEFILGVIVFKYCGLSYPIGTRIVFDALSDYSSGVEDYVHETLWSSERIGYALLMRIVGSKTGKKLWHIVYEDIYKYANEILYSSWHCYQYWDDYIARADQDLARILYKYICKNGGIGKYIAAVKSCPDGEVIDRSYAFLSIVDPDNTEGWREYYDV
jgi:hypothetical protein